VENNLIEYGVSKLKENNIDTQLAYYLYKYLNNLDVYKEAVDKLIKGIPVQYIVGNVDFYGLIFDINENVLIPRFETEELVEKSIKYINDFFKNKVDIVDIGTGSGCIAISLKKNLECNMDAVDISNKALEVAKANAKKLDADIDFYNGDLLNPLTKKYDVIISNPPYIADNEEIMEMVKNNEPHIALYADNEGLKNYEEILKNAKAYLKDKSMIIFEIGQTQGVKIREIALKYFPNSTVKIEKDMQGRDRFIFIFNEL
jgi:release factor glutamine methyltransferase